MFSAQTHCTQRLLPARCYVFLVLIYLQASVLRVFTSVTTMTVLVNLCCVMERKIAGMAVTKIIVLQIVH